MIAKMLSGKLNECAAKTKGRALIRVRLAQKETQPNIVHSKIAPESANRLRQIGAHRLDAVNHIAEVCHGVTSKYGGRFQSIHGERPLVPNAQAQLRAPITSSPSECSEQTMSDESERMPVSCSAMLGPRGREEKNYRKEHSKAKRRPRLNLGSPHTGIQGCKSRLRNRLTAKKKPQPDLSRANPAIKPWKLKPALRIVRR